MRILIFSTAYLPFVGGTEVAIKEITDRYNEQLSPYYAAARLWVDGIISPLDTRKVISMGIEAANHNPITKRFNMGVLQV